MTRRYIGNIKWKHYDSITSATSHIVALTICWLRKYARFRKKYKENNFFPHPGKKQTILTLECAVPRALVRIAKMWNINPSRFVYAREKATRVPRAILFPLQLIISFRKVVGKWMRWKKEKPFYCQTTYTVLLPSSFVFQPTITSNVIFMLLLFSPKHLFFSLPFQTNLSTC